MLGARRSRRVLGAALALALLLLPGGVEGDKDNGRSGELAAFERTGSAAAIDVSARLSSGLSGGLSNEWVQYEDEEHPNHPLEQEPVPVKQQRTPAHEADSAARAAFGDGGSAGGGVLRGLAVHTPAGNHAAVFATAAVVKVGRGQTVDAQGVVAPTGNFAAAKEGDADADAAEGESGEAGEKGEEGETGEKGEVGGEKHKPFNAAEAADSLQSYVEEHPGFAAGSLGWVIVGAILFVTAVVVLIFSELRVVLVVRDQDFRRTLRAGGYMEATELVSELEVKEANSQAARPYIVQGVVVALFFAVICVLKPFCNVLDIIGLPSRSCFITVLFAALVAAVTVTTLIMGVCWSCTRSWAALVLITIGLSGQILCMSGNPFLVVVWGLGSGLLFLAYFVLGAEHSALPEYMHQSIGPLTASMDPLEWKRAANASAQAGLEDFKAVSHIIPGGNALVESASKALEEDKEAEASAARSRKRPSAAV